METADLIIMNVQVCTVDEANLWAEAAVVRGSRIMQQQAVRWQGTSTRVIDGQVVYETSTGQRLSFLR